MQHEKENKEKTSAVASYSVRNLRKPAVSNDFNCHHVPEPILKNEIIIPLFETGIKLCSTTNPVHYLIIKKSCRLYANRSLSGAGNVQQEKLIVHGDGNKT